MMWNLQSYPTTVLNEIICHFGGSKYTLTLLHIFKGSRLLQTPMIYAPAIFCWYECYLELIAQHVAVCVVLNGPRNFTVIALEESLVQMTWQQPQYDIQPTRYVAMWCEGASSCLVLLLRFHCRDANSWLMLLHLSQLKSVFICAKLRVSMVFAVGRCPTVCLSLLSVTFVYCIQTAEDIVFLDPIAPSF